MPSCTCVLIICKHDPPRLALLPAGMVYCNFNLKAKIKCMSMYEYELFPIKKVHIQFLIILFQMFMVIFLILKKENLKDNILFWVIIICLLKMKYFTSIVLLFMSVFTVLFLMMQQLKILMEIKKNNALKNLKLINFKDCKKVENVEEYINEHYELKNYLENIESDISHINSITFDENYVLKYYVLMNYFKNIESDISKIHLILDKHLSHNV